MLQKNPTDKILLEKVPFSKKMLAYSTVIDVIVGSFPFLFFLANNTIASNKVYLAIFVVIGAIIYTTFAVFKFMGKKYRDEDLKETNKLQNEINSLKSELEQSNAILLSDRVANNTVLSFQRTIRVNLLDKFDAQHAEYIIDRLNDTSKASIIDEACALDAFKRICDALNNFLMFYIDANDVYCVQVCLLGRQKKEFGQENKPVWAKIVGQSSTNFKMDVFKDDSECYKKLRANGKIMMTKKEACEKNFYIKHTSDVLKDEMPIGTILYRRTTIKRNDDTEYEYILVGDIRKHEIDFNADKSEYLNVFFDRAAKKIKIYGSINHYHQLHKKKKEARQENQIKK